MKEIKEGWKKEDSKKMSKEGRKERNNEVGIHGGIKETQELINKQGIDK